MANFEDVTVFLVINFKKVCFQCKAVIILFENLRI